MANTLQYSCLENPPDRGAWQARSTGSQRVDTMQPCMHRYKTFFACGSSAPVRVECEDGVAAWLVGTQVFRDTYRLHRKSYGPIRVSFRASCSWRSEGLFGQSLSLALLIQVLRGLPCLGSFSVVRHIRHIEGPTRLGSYSVDWCIRHLKGHPGRGPTL